MSSLLVIQNNDDVLMVADTALSAKLDNKIYRVYDDYEKVFYHNDYCVFISGKTDIVEYITNKIINIKYNLLNKLSMLLSNLKCEKYDVEIVISELNNNSSEVHIFSSYNHFKHSKSIIKKNESKIFSAGIKTNEIIDEFLKNYDGLDIVNSLLNTYNTIQDETVGGYITIFNLQSKSKKKLKLKAVQLNRISLNDTHLLVAERVVGRMIVGQKLLIRNDEGTVTIDGATVSVKDRSDNVKVNLGEYEKDKFGLQVLDGAVTIRTKGTTGNTGLILDKDGIRSYDTNGKQTFNIDGNAGSATFSGTVNAGTIIGSTINGGTITGTDISGSTITSTNGAVVTQMTGGKLQFYNNGEDYGSLLPTALNLKYSETLVNGNSYYATVKKQSTLNGYKLIMTYDSTRYDGYRQSQTTEISALGLNFIDNDSNADNSFTINGGKWYFSNSEVSFLYNTPVNIYSSLNLNGYPVATQNYVQSQLSNYWVRGSSSGALSSNVYVTANSISVGGSWIGDSSTPYTNIGTNNIYIPGKYYSGGSAVTSDINKKKNIIPYDKNVLEQIVDTQVYTYNLKTELDSEFPHLGIMLQEAPVDVVDPEGGVELYAMISFVWKAIQELYKKDEGYRERVEILESLTNQQTDTLNELLSNLQGVSCQLNN